MDKRIERRGEKQWSGCEGQSCPPSLVHEEHLIFVLSSFRKCNLLGGFDPNFSVFLAWFVFWFILELWFSNSEHYCRCLLKI